MIALIRAAVFGLLTALSLPHTAFAQRELPDFSQLVEQQARAVVNISTTQKVSARPMPQMPPGVDEDDPMFDFFRRLFRSSRERRAPRTRGRSAQDLSFPPTVIC